MLEVCLARREDCPAVAALERECFSRPQSEESFLRMTEDEGALLLLARREGAFCGYVSAYVVLDRLQILTVAVTAAHRRMGVARALLQQLFPLAAQRNCTAVELEVRSRNAPAIALYRSLGFVSVGLRKGYYTNPADDAILMDRSLVPPF